jgi:hypothetical protein
VTFPWGPFAPQSKPLTPRELMLERLANGVPPELAVRAAGVDWETIKDDPEVDKALAEGEILLFERARDSGVTGVVRAAMRRETKTWTPKAEPNSGATLEDLLRD